MIVPKNHWFVIYSVDNFWLSEGEVLITQLLSHLLFINYFWGRNENYFYRSILTQVTQKVVFIPLLT